MLCHVTFGNLQIVSADMILRPGPEPSACALTAMATDIPPLVDTLGFYNDSQLMAYFPYATPDIFSLRIVRHHNKGFFWHLRVKDRRWLWRDVHISGRYNLRTAAGNFRDSKYKRSARELGAILLNQLNDSNYWIDDLPDDDYPEVNWDASLAAYELQSLADRYSCRICLGADNIVRVVSYAETQGQANTEEGDIADQWTYSLAAPSAITVVGAPIVYQNHYWCESAALRQKKTGEEIIPTTTRDIWQNPWVMPTGRSDYPGIADAPYSWIGMENPRTQLRSQLTHYQHWRPYCVADGYDSTIIGDIPIEHADPGEEDPEEDPSEFVRVDLETSKQIQLLPYLIGEHDAAFDRSSGITDLFWAMPEKPYVSFSEAIHEYGYNPLASLQSFPKGIQRGQDVPVLVDTHRGFVETPLPLPEEKVSIVLAHQARDKNTLGLKRFKYTRSLPGGIFPKIEIQHNDIQMHVIGDWDLSGSVPTYLVTHNYGTCKEIADRIINEAAEKWLAPLRQQRYSGFAYLSPNRMIHEVRWMVQYMQPAFTHVSYRPLA